MKLVAFVLSSILTATASAQPGYKSITPLEANAYNANSKECCFLDWGFSGWFSQDREFPDAQVYSVKTGKMVSIRELVKDRPIVLEMGSMTCPAYDLNIPHMKDVAAKYKDQVDFYTLYVRENHPNDKFKVHTTLEQKIEYAKELVKQSNLQHSVLVDDVNGSFHQTLGNFGNAVFLVGKDMRTNHWSIFGNAKQLEKGIVALMKADGIAGKAKFVGGTDIHPLSQKAYSAEEKKATMQRMYDRGEPLPDPKKVAAKKDLEGSAKQIIAQMNSGTRQRLETFTTALTPVAEKKKVDPAKSFLELQEAFRIEYTQRYDRWKKINKIDDKTNLAAEQLKDPQ